MALDKRTRRLKVKARIRKIVSGTPENPRISVFRSNKHIYAQVIDDLNGVTLASASTKIKEIAEKIEGLNKSQQAELVGKTLAERALNANVKNVVFDRSGYKYHGRIKSLAEGARKGGLIF
ncbi:MAG: 50S ribosomal protein L18 [Bacteroidales bacterium]|nr:50S ribosomal protein L18 [Bacteroidales bacterium]